MIGGRHAAQLLAFVAVALLAMTSSLDARGSDGPPGAGAKSPEDEARAAMREGLAAFDRGDFEAALERYETAKRLVPNANAPYFFAAKTLEKLGRFREAIMNLELYLAKDPTVSDAAQVKDHIASLRAEHLPGRLRVHTNAAADDVLVLVDGKEVGRGDAVIEVTPGPHRVEARAARRSAVSKDISITSDEEASLTLVFADASPPPPPIVTPRDTTPPPPSSEPFPWRTVGWITCGVGVATVATSFVVDVALLGPKIDDFRRAYENLDDRASSLRTEVDHLQTGVAIGYVVGGVLIASGITLVLLAPRAKTAPSGATRTIDSNPLRFRF